jgi:hypothetical protein
MSEHQATRTLVKSPPELWAECSDARSLARHLGDAVGEIRITRLEPETAVAWEGEHISGTVRLEPSGWGTRVTLAVAPDTPALVQQSEPEEPEPEQPVVEHSEPVAVAAHRPPRTRFFARIRRWFAPAEAPAPPAEVPAPPAEAPAPPAEAPAPPAEAAVAPPPLASPGPGPHPIDLVSALDSLGKAHHRPFSRA